MQLFHVDRVRRFFNHHQVRIGNQLDKPGGVFEGKEQIPVAGYDTGRSGNPSEKVGAVPFGYVSRNPERMGCQLRVSEASPAIRSKGGPLPNTSSYCGMFSCA